MNANNNTLVHPAPQKAGVQDFYQVTSSAPLEKSDKDKKKKLKLPNQNDNNSNMNILNPQNNNNNQNNSNIPSQNVPNAFQQDLQQPIIYQPPPPTQYPNQPQFPPYIQQQQQYMGPSNSYQIINQNQQVQDHYRQQNMNQQQNQHYLNQNKQMGQYNKKNQIQTNVIATNNSQTPQNTPSIIKDSNQQQFFGGIQPNQPQAQPYILEMLSTLTVQTPQVQQQQQPQQQQQMQQQQQPQQQTMMPQKHQQSNYNSYNKNPGFDNNQQYDQNKFYNQNKGYNKDDGYKKSYQRHDNNEDTKQKEQQLLLQQQEEQRQKLELQKKLEEEKLAREKQEQEERIRLENERQAELERKRIEEERRKAEEEEKRKEEEKRREEERQEQEKLLLQERKRPTFEKIQYFITGLINQTIKITYDDGTDEEFKKSIEKFEERKLTDVISDDKKAPMKSSYAGGTKKTERSSNVQNTNTGGYSRASQANVQQNSNIITRQAPDPYEIILQESAKRGWLNQQAQVDEKTQKLKDIKRLVNILTYDNIEKLKVDFLKYAMDNTTCQEVIAAVMEKAITEIKYTALYGQICKFLNDEIKKNSKDSQFKNIFISQIQEKFDNIASVLKVKQNKPLSSLTPEERTDFHNQRKKRIILLVKFIGELFILSVISKHVIKIVIAELFTKYFKYKDVVTLEESNDDYIHYDDCLQGIIELYEITGPSLDNNQKKDSKIDIKSLNDIKKEIMESKTISQQWYTQLENIGFSDMMAVLETYKDYGDVSHRIKALLQNLIERRAKNWEERLFQKEKPKTLQEIKQEHEKDLQQRAEEVENFIKHGGKNTFTSQYRTNTQQPPAKRPTGRGYTNTFQTNKDDENEEVDEDEKKSQIKNSTNTYNDLFGPSSVPQQVEKKSEPRIDYESKVKEIYKKIDKSDEVDQCNSEIQELINKDKKKVLTFMIRMCYTEKKEQNITRTQYLISLTKQKSFSPKDVIDSLNSNFSTAQKEACDYPDVYKCLALIIESLVVDFSSQFNLQDIKIELTDDEDDDFDILYFFEELFGQLVKLFKDKNVDLTPLKESLTKVYANAKLDESEVSNQVSKFF